VQYVPEKIPSHLITNGFSMSFKSEIIVAGFRQSENIDFRYTEVIRDEDSSVLYTTVQYI